jgi:hypothetical protein
MTTSTTATVVSPAATLAAVAAASMQMGAGDDVVRAQQRADSTINGVVIGLVSSFGSALLIGLIFLVVYFFRYTSSGRILLDRLGRPGEYDDEQAFAREEAEALEEMDDLQRTEYFRAKGISISIFVLTPAAYGSGGGEEAVIQSVANAKVLQHSSRPIRPTRYRPIFPCHST